MSKVIAHAPAKINFVLEVEALRAGEEKHRLDSVFCTTALADTLVFDFVSGPEPFNAQVSLKSTNSDTSYVKPHDNTLIKTVEHFKRSYGFGFLPSGILEVELIKSIPTQAGLGGGSSDAAAMLRMLCWLAQVEPTSEKSLAIAQAVGADVAFFLHAPKTGLCAYMGGFGDELLEVLPKPQLPLVLVKPNCGVSTRKAYAAFDKEKQQKTGVKQALALCNALAQGVPAQRIAALCTNDLESIAMRLQPEIAILKEELRSLPGVLGTTMTGSGSAVFAICEDAAAARASMQHFAQQGLWTVATQT